MNRAIYPGSTSLTSLASTRAEAAHPGKQTLVEQVMRKAKDGAGDEPDVHAAAARGIATPASSLPHASTIQRLFGRHDISGIQAHTGDAAARSAGAMGAQAFATGNHVVLGSDTSLHTVAHEAAHVVQQRAGVHLKGGVGEVGDVYERHADAVADAVVRGESAESLLDAYAGGGGSAAAGTHVQRSIVAQHDFAGRGRLAIDMQPQMMDGRFGEGGSIRFSPQPGGERAGEITLVQVVRNASPQGEDMEWRGEQQPRELMKTPQLNNGVEGGWFLDHDSSRLAMRQQSTDASVRRDYNATIPGAEGDDRKGYNLGPVQNDVVLFDHPAASQPMTWRFETAVFASREDQRDMRWGTVQWGFATRRTQGGQRNGTLTAERWEAHNEYVAFADGTSPTFESAVAHFDEYYRNPEAYAAPERLERALLERAQARRDHGLNSSEYVAAHRKVWDYGEALKRLMAIPPPAYENPHHVETFRALQAVFAQLLQLAVARSNQQYHQPDEGLPPVGQQPVPQQPDPNDEQDMELETEEQRIARLRAERQARWAQLKQHGGPENKTT